MDRAELKNLVKESVYETLDEFEKKGLIKCPTDNVYIRVKDGNAKCPVCKAVYNGEHWIIEKEPETPKKNTKKDDDILDFSDI